ncbi:MAG: penicillin acylase family protein [Solirubrobacterales bacterium]
MRRQATATIATAALLTACALAPNASAQVQPYRANDFGGFRNILPPGQGQTVNGAEAAAFLGGGTLPENYDDQREMYGDLVFASPGLSSAQIDQFFKDGSFGVPPGQQKGMPYSPGARAGLTVVRDSFNVPHIYGATRDDVMFGAGYVGAEDRLFFMDVLRHAGRAKLSSFAGPSNRAMDAEQWEVAPYREQDFQRQIDLADEVYGAEGARLQQDLAAYIAGINQYISEARLDPSKMPAEYAAVLKPQGPTDWKGTDVMATASLIGGIFGKGGGGEIGNAEVISAAKARFGAGPGEAAWADFRQANDPEAPTTVRGRSFPYQERTGVDSASVAIPKPGTLVEGSPDDAPSLGGVIEGILGGLGGLPGGSNALLVSASESASGHPLAVFGPQVAYFAPQILLEQDMHGPDIDARGATFAGVSLYVLLGRGQDYAWSATSAGQDIIDTFAERLCEPDGSTPTIDSMHYLYRGQCRPIEVLENVQITNPNPGDPGDGPGELPEPPQPYTLKAQRTVHGIVSKRGMVEVNGEDVPVAFARLRSTYFHEADSARAFSALNQPSRVQSAEDFQRVMHDINFTFNWFYADDRDIAYFNSGANPVRAPGTDPEFPTWGTGEWDWQGWDPVLDPNAPGLGGGTNFADYTPFSEHPQVINQDYLTSWNNKQAPGYRSSEAQYGYSSIYRSEPLDDRIEAGILGGRTMNLAELIDAMEDAGTVDLRGDKVLPFMLEVIESGPGGVPADLADEVATLKDWVASGAHRRDRDDNGSYDHSDAVRLMDAWWDPPGDPLADSAAPQGVLEAAFRPTLGDDLFVKLRSQLAYDNPPNNHGAHLGSAYQDGWWGQLEKDLRSILGEGVEGAHSRRYCGAPDQNTEGTLAACREALVESLRAAAGLSAEQVYGGDDAAGCADGDQMCFDEVRFRTVGAVSVEPIHWINRPTWQQVVEVQGHRGRGGPVAAPGPAPGVGPGVPLTAGLTAQPPIKTAKKKRCKKRAKKKRGAAGAAKKKRAKGCAKKKRKGKRKRR